MSAEQTTPVIPEAEQFPRQSYVDIATNGPDLSKYKAMETVASASGSEAEARRRELGRWSIAAGQLADASATINARREQIDGTHEDVREVLTDSARHVAENGVTVTDEDGITRKLKQLDGAIQVKNGNGINGYVLRSPATINNPAPVEAPEPVAPPSLEGVSLT